MNWLPFLFASVAGAFITVQAGSNSQLKKSLGEPMPAVIVNYVLGLCVVIAYSLARQLPIFAFEKASGSSQSNY